MRWEDWPPRDEALKPGFAAWREGALERARGIFAAHVAACPEDDDGWRGLGSVDWTMGRFEAALAAFQACLRLAPANAMHWANLGLAYRDLRAWDRAEAAFRTSLALCPDYAPALNEWANVLVDTGRYAEALSLYDRALAIDPARAVVHHNKGVCLRLSGDPAAAARSFRAALSRDPFYRHSIDELRRLAPDSVAAALPLS